MEKRREKKSHDRVGCHHQAYPSGAKPHANKLMYAFTVTYGFLTASQLLEYIWVKSRRREFQICFPNGSDAWLL